MTQIAKGESGRVLMLEGDLNIRTANELHRALCEFVDRASRVTLDLSAVESCDTAALQLFYSAAKTAQKAGKHFEVVALSPAVANTAAALGLQAGELAVHGANNGVQRAMAAPGGSEGTGRAV